MSVVDSAAARKLLEAANAAENENHYGAAWVDQPWHDHIEDFIGDGAAVAAFIANASPELVAALVAGWERRGQALAEAERALADAEAIITRDGLGAWVGSLVLERAEGRRQAEIVVDVSTAADARVAVLEAALRAIAGGYVTQRGSLR